MNQQMVDDLDWSASEGAKVAKESNKGGDFAREIERFNLDGSEAGAQQGKNTGILRLCTEFERKPWMVDMGYSPYSLAWITVKQHYAPTKHKPPYAREGAQWPEKMFAVCRKDKIFAKRFNDQCYICDTIGNKPSDRTWGLGIERQQVIDETTKQVLGLQDKTREVLVFGPDGKPIVTGKEGDKEIYERKIVPAWVYLNFGWKNFFGNLAGVASYYQTVLDRDFFVTRTGTGTDSNYAFVGLDKYSLTGDFAKQIGVEDGTPYDLGHVIANLDGKPVPLMQALYPEMPDLRQIISARVNDDFYGRWFIPGWVPEGFDPNAPKDGAVKQGVQSGYQPPQQPTTPSTPQQQPGGSAAPSALDALRARVSGGSQPVGS